MLLKKLILWEHERGTWQYDIFCLLIIAFIFLTPKAWFNNREPLATQTAHLTVEALDLSRVPTAGRFYSNGKTGSPNLARIERPR